MNKNILKYVPILLIFTTISLYTVEERNPMPFYYLMKKPLLLKLNLKSYKICRIKLNNVIENKKIEILDCYKIEKRISDSIKMIHEKNPKKNELNLMFIDENKKVVNPELQTSEGVYKVKSFIFFKKTKEHHIELNDKNGGYYYFTYNPLNMNLVE